MLADFELNEIDRLNQIFDRLVQVNQQERARLASLLQMLRAVGVDAWLDPDGEITVVNRALEAPYPAGDWPWVSTEIPETTPITLPRAIPILGPGYFGLGADGT